jgi:hypothetical protein
VEANLTGPGAPRAGLPSWSTPARPRWCCRTR